MSSELKPGESDALEELTQAIASRWQSRKDFPSSYADQKVSGMTRTAKSLRVSLEEARINGPISFLGTAVEGNLHSRRRDGLTDLGFPCVVDGVGRVSSGINTHERWTLMAAEGKRGIQAAVEAEARRPFDL